MKRSHAVVCNDRLMKGKLFTNVCRVSFIGKEQ